MTTTMLSNNMLSDAASLSDDKLCEKLPLLARSEGEATAALVAHLAVFDARQLYLGEGCSSLFTYCTRVLHLSEHAAYNRIEAARAAREYPVILPMLADGSLHLAAVRLLAPELTPANHAAVLAAARHKSKREVEELVAALRPKPPVPSMIRRLPARPYHVTTPSPDGTPPLAAAVPPNALGDRDGTMAPPPPAAIAQPAATPVVAPLAPERFKIQFTADRETHDLLRRAQGLLRHQVPDGNVAEVMARALKLLVKELEREKFAATSRPREGGVSPASDPAAGSRHIPAEVKRRVWARDRGSCAFVARDGRRCGERAFLEFHHVVPYGAGGRATVDNIQLRCRPHNGYEAELFFGRRPPILERQVPPPHADDDPVAERIVGFPVEVKLRNPVVQRMVQPGLTQDGPHGIAGGLPEPGPVPP